MELPCQPWRGAATLLLALAVLSGPLVGLGAADSDTSQSYVAVQGENCTPIPSFSGEKSPKEFYDYRIPNAENPYINTTGGSYSSEGTRALQRPNTSIVFLYTDERNDTLSLAFVHGNVDNESSVGGSATFNITGLPEDGRWTVKDDEYNGTTRYDNWSADSGDTVVNWTWGAKATDGGVYTGLGEEANVTVQPAFNEDAELYEEFYEGDVEQWEVLSNETDDNVTRTTLERNETLQIAAGTCDDIGGAVPADDDDTRDERDSEDERDDRDEDDQDERDDRDEDDQDDEDERDDRDEDDQDDEDERDDRDEDARDERDTSPGDGTENGTDNGTSPGDTLPGDGTDNGSDDDNNANDSDEADDSDESDDSGPPDNAGPPDNSDESDESDDSNESGPPDNAGPPDNSDESDESDDSNESGPPDNAGPPGNSGPPEDPAAIAITHIQKVTS